MKSSHTTDTDKDKKIGKYTVHLSHLDKLFWPDEGYTKGDLVRYYEQMADYILPHLKGRPLSLKRNPNGILDEGFYHKDAGEHVPAYVDVYKVKSESSHKIIDYIVCNNKATLLYLANLGCIEMNPWNSTIAKPGNPTWMVIDLDPSPQNKFTEVVDTALLVKSVLEKAGVAAYCKTSGATGLHVYVPLHDKYPYATIKKFAKLVASLVNKQLPESTTLERSLAKRNSRIYIDYLQNTKSQTLASVYSLRPVQGAFVSTPLDWKELNHRLRPSQFNIKTILKRVKEKGDRFSPVLKSTIAIEKAMRLLAV